MKITNRCKILWFWLIAFRIVVWQTIKGNDWQMLMVDFQYGDDAKGRPIRRQLIAKKHADGFHIYWQDLSVFWKDFLERSK